MSALKFTIKKIIPPLLPILIIFSFSYTASYILYALSKVHISIFIFSMPWLVVYCSYIIKNKYMKYFYFCMSRY